MPEDFAAGHVAATRIGREQGWDVVERRRRQLAERVARELAFAVAGPLGSLPGGVNGLLAGSAVTVTLASTVELQQALDDLPSVITFSQGRSSEFLDCVRGPAGKVVFYHSDIYSVVFTYRPFTGVIVVCADDVHGYCLVLDDDSPPAVAAVEQFRALVDQRITDLRDQAVTPLFIDD